MSDIIAESGGWVRRPALTGTYVVLTPKQEAKVRRKSFEEAHPDASLDLLDLTIRPMYEME